MSRVTILDVARTAGVSTSTVSNLLNGRTDKMHPHTRQRVESAIRDLGYRPNRAARQLRIGQPDVIGLVVPSVGNPYWGALARYLEAAALAEGYHVLLCNSERDPDRERHYIDELLAEGVRGIVLCSSLHSLEHVTELLDQGLRLVAFDRSAQATDPPSLVSVSVNNVVGGELMGNHLTSLGHRRIAFVSGAIRSINRTERLRGFLHAAERAGIAKDEITVWGGSADAPLGDVEAAEVGRAATAELLANAEPPTAIFAVNDMTAIGVCRAIRDAGLEVGRDISVAGFDDIMLAELYAPRLTTVRQPMKDMAAAAFESLHAAVETEDPTPGSSLLFRPELVVRESTAAPA
ncbi:LacI family DNA-binding transcriptional regulator [Brooklawnia cerclae]|uniref:DNA-binding LacI/PurR family transcriptional regulator n=1 Tax=Brooklawnia cerclae TaxID=349934 RepID=A0ABX0SMR1_9ACTN|nr:LacI family DNA-binding transcriptional regulator [Brooklawnia cerclae]NIH58613.1 DNA-binding LacI/PurR family transcriptional regulator [Brooklawnia cerclae]